MTEPANDAEDRMVKIGKLIADMQSVKDRFGDTCVYIRRGGLSWGAVALNRRDDDKKHGVFDLQQQHDRDMLARLEQIERLKASRDGAEQEVRRLTVELASSKLQITGLEHTVAGQRQALEAVWEDWTIANDASGMEHYEIKDVSPETVVLVQVTLRVPRMANSIASGPLSDVDMKAQALRCSCRGHDDFCVCQNVPDRTTIRERIAAAESAADALTLTVKERTDG